LTLTCEDSATYDASEAKTRRETLTKGAKIAIGCVVAAIAAFVVIVVVVVGLGVWGKSKLDTVTADVKRTEELKRSANANAFVRPESRVISEDRLLAFLDVRKTVFAVYERHRAEIESRSKNKQAGIGDVMTMGKILAEVHAAQAQGQADARMSDDEYAFLRESIYRSAWASERQAASGGKTMEETARESYREADRSLDQAASQEGLSDEQRQVIQNAQKELAGQSERTAEEAAGLDVPPENLALFRKHEQAIRKYAMTGLEWLGI
jgi:hypothetical protein